MEEKSKEEKEKERIEGVRKALVSMICGLFAGAISFLAGGGDPFYRSGWLILLTAIIIQRPILARINITLKGGKDWLYISFLTFIIWFMSWAIMLMS